MTMKIDDNIRSIDEQCRQCICVVSSFLFDHQLRLDSTLLLNNFNSLYVTESPRIGRTW